jgi:hypothetical protein
MGSQNLYKLGVSEGVVEYQISELWSRKEFKEFKADMRVYFVVCSFMFLEVKLNQPIPMFWKEKLSGVYSAGVVDPIRHS